MAFYKILSAFLIVLSVFSSNVLSMGDDLDEFSQEKTPLKSAPKLKSKWGFCASCCHDEDVEVHPRYYKWNTKQLKYSDSCDSFWCFLTCGIFESSRKIITYDGEKMTRYQARDSWRRGIQERDNKVRQAHKKAHQEAHEKEMKDIDYNKATYKGMPISYILQSSYNIDTYTRGINKRTLEELHRVDRAKRMRDYEEEGKKPEVQQKRKEEAERKHKLEEERKLKAEREKATPYEGPHRGCPPGYCKTGDPHKCRC